jgi:translation elongation factor EF-1beta
MSEITNDQPNSVQKTREVEVQFTVKWVNFTYNVEDATSGVDAVDRALASFKQNGLKEFTITAGNEECSDLDDIFHVAEDFTKATDENGNDVVGWEEWIDENEDETE